MKTMKLLFTLLFVAAFASLSFGQNIVGSAHDFTDGTWFTPTNDEICIACHTPHNGDGTVDEAPLWNHEVTATVAFTLYSGSTLDATVGQPSAESKLCLSCHDGTVALDSYGGATGTEFIAGGDLVGTDLSDDHPISFTYDDGLATTDGGLHPPSTASSGLSGTIATDLLFGGEMQCASCHDVHGTANPSLLRVSNTGSELCLTCHNK